MVNERRQKGIPNWQRQAWLTEYEACQEKNSSDQIRFWTVAGIFIGISSALIAGLMYGILANELLFDLFLETIADASDEREIWTLRIVISMLSLVILFIFWFLRLWMRRVGFLNQINYERMRDIERELGMWHNWRVFGVDRWRGNNFHDRDRNRLLAYQPAEFWQAWRRVPRYGQPNRLNYNMIFGAIIFLWSLLIASLWVPFLSNLLPTSSIPCLIILIIDLVLAAIIAFLVIFWTRPG